MGGIYQPSLDVDRLLDTLEQERVRNPNEPDRAQMAYVPFYTLGNICMSRSISLLSFCCTVLTRLLVGWILTLLQARFRLAVPFISLALLIQLYAAMIMGYTTTFRLSRHNWTTHVVSKSLMTVIWGSYMQMDDPSDAYEAIRTAMAFNLVSFYFSGLLY
jgi:hypothetical protein